MTFPHGTVERIAYDLASAPGVSLDEIRAAFDADVSSRRPTVDASQDRDIVAREDALASDPARAFMQMTLERVGGGAPGPMVVIDQRQSLLDSFLIAARVGEYATATESALRKKAAEVEAKAAAEAEAARAAAKAEFDKAVADLVAERRRKATE